MVRLLTECVRSRAPLREIGTASLKVIMLTITKSIFCAILIVATVFADRSYCQESVNALGDDEILKQTAKHFIDTRTVAQIRKDNVLHFAAEKGDAAAVRAALKDGANVNSFHINPNPSMFEDAWSGYTALMFASRYGHTDVIEALIEAKADLNLECRQFYHVGETSLYMAVKFQQDAVAEMLVKAGAKGDPKQMRLATELLRAACQGFEIRKGEGYPLDPGAIGVLGLPKGYLEFDRDKQFKLRQPNPENADRINDVIKRGADVNATDIRGYTALMYAANLGLVENVEALLAAGADPMLKTKSGVSVFTLLEQDSSVANAERKQVAALLKAHVEKKK
jgi:uncharacterized protein